MTAFSRGHHSNVNQEQPLGGYLHIGGIGVRGGRLHAFETQSLKVECDGFAHRAYFARPPGGCGRSKHNRRRLASTPSSRFLSVQPRSSISSSLESCLFQNDMLGGFSASSAQRRSISPPLGCDRRRQASSFTNNSSLINPSAICAAQHGSEVR